MKRFMGCYSLSMQALAMAEADGSIICVGILQEFKCEICGNASYWGRRAFERHFKEYRHQNGMRALGIPNSKLFFEVTQIAEAQHLWKNVQARHSMPQLLSSMPQLPSSYSGILCCKISSLFTLKISLPADDRTLLQAAYRSLMLAGAGEGRLHAGDGGGVRRQTRQRVQQEDL